MAIGHNVNSIEVAVRLHRDELAPRERLNSPCTAQMASPEERIPGPFSESTPFECYRKVGTVRRDNVRDTTAIEMTRNGDQFGQKRAVQMGYSGRIQISDRGDELRINAESALLAFEELSLVLPRWSRRCRVFSDAEEHDV